ncbi:type I secretion protein [Rhodobacteraceae bacterium PD-2]|nr:type I secretion protein [Rhodobacteraceae bacterium PD-2]
MADLILNWGALGPFGTQVTDTGGVSATVDTGGVAVDITYNELAPGTQASTFNADGYVAAGEDINPNSHLKLLGDNALGASDTSSVSFDFRSTSTDLYTDSVQNLTFRLNDIDAGPEGDRFSDGTGYEDIVSVAAYDADGNEVPVTLTPANAVSVAGDTATGTTEGDYDAATGSVLVFIPGPVTRIEISYANGDASEQTMLVSDVHFSTVDVGDGDDNNPPTAVNDSVATDMDTAATLYVLGNDVDPDGDALTITGNTDPANGSAVLNADGSFTYTPNAGFTGVDTFTYTITDGEFSSTAEVRVVVGMDPDELPPVAIDDTASTVEGTPVSLDPIANDTDPEGETLSLDSVGAASNGTVTVNADGTVTYTPNDGFTGTDSFTYEVVDPTGLGDTGPVTVTVGETPPPPPPANDPPVAVDDELTTGSDTAVTLDPAANDTDPDGDDLTTSSVGTPSEGTATLNPDGTVTYTPPAGFTGIVTIPYTVTDGDLTDEGLITIEVEEIVPCFTPGTLIATPKGERLVEDLEVGDRVITRDNGIQEIKWVGRKDLTGFDLARKPQFKPILIQQGALGNNLPEHDMLVSPNHRVLVANDKTTLYFEEREVLVAAKHLTGLDGVDEVEANGVSYIHVMFDQHEVILSNGAWTESFQPGDYSLKGIGNAQREEILELFPELEHAEGLKAYGSARRSLKKHEAALLTK